ncbi:MAG: division/cell wall cluster transcriptional repressor MraZ, partial [Deltaproteobacteria bacterium]|nr:division/cell wall cluster transcriptional repressor MraZ [Deltaproteobacteria bacterium]
PGNRYLSLLTFEVWQEQSVIWSQEDRFPSTAIRVAAQRMFFSNIEMVQVDKTGRILIPAHCRERIGLELSQKLLVKGVGRRIELWNPAEYEANQEHDLALVKKALELDEQRGVLSAELGRFPEC